MRTQTLNKFYKTLLALSFVGGTAMLEMSCAKKKKNSLRDAGGNAEERENVKKALANLLYQGL